jgi:hypothetical protein
MKKYVQESFGNENYPKDLGFVGVKQHPILHNFFRTIKLRVNGALEDQIRAQIQVNLKDNFIMSKKKIFNDKLVHN